MNMISLVFAREMILIKEKEPTMLRMRLSTRRFQVMSTNFMAAQEEVEVTNSMYHQLKSISLALLIYSITLESMDQIE